MVCKYVAVRVEVSDRYLINSSQLLPVFRATNPSNVPEFLYKSRILKLSSATLISTKVSQLCQDVKNNSQGSMTGVTPSLVSQTKVKYKRVEATLQAQQQRYQRYQG